MAQKIKDDFEPDDFEPEIGLPESSSSPEMNFAIVNGVKVPLGSDTADMPELANYIPQSTQVHQATELTRPEPSRPEPGILERLTTPLVDVSPQMRQHMSEFEKTNPITGKVINTTLDLILGESAPLSLGLGAFGAGESVAAGLGKVGLARLLKVPSQTAGGAMVWHGMDKVGNEDTLGGKLGGVLEAALGGLALRGPKAARSLGVEEPNRVPVTRIIDENLPLSSDKEDTWFVLGHPDDEKIAQLNDMYKSGKGKIHKTYLDSSLVDRSQSMSDEFGNEIIKVPSNKLLGSIPEFNSSSRLGQSLPNEINPKLNLERPLPITPEDSDWFKKFIQDESGSVNLPDFKNRRRPLKALDELHDALIDASKVEQETAQLYKGERSKRFADVEEVNTQGRKGFYERLSKLKGELPKAVFNPVDINPDSARALYNEINRSSLSTPEKIRASTGLGKVLGDYGNGQAPQRNEIDMLRRVFGDPVADQLMNMHAGVPITSQVLNEVANFSKSMMSSFDASAPFRQGLGLVHTREFWKNYSKMYSYIGRGAYDAAMESINSDALFEPLRKAGLQITEIGAELGAREEQFASRLAEKIPGVPASERMYTGFLNKTRFDVGKRLIQEAENAGLKPFVKNSAGGLVPTSLGKEITKFVNTATGRGSLGRFEKNAVELNSLFFSPRLISSRLTMLNPAYYIKADPFVRKQALKSLFAMATAGKIVEELGKAAGGTVETDDKTSSDYHKVRIGNTRIDPYGGFQQYITAANRLLGGAVNSSTGNEDEMSLKTTASRTLGIGGRFPSFIENKLSPLAKFADDIAFGRPASDNAKSGNAILNVAKIPHSAETAKLANLFTPMMIQDLQELMLEDPSLLPLSLLNSQGMGVQTYPESEENNGFRSLSR